MKIILPWPDSKLSPNARLHWAQKAKLVKIWREIGFVETKRQAGKVMLGAGMIDLHITFHAPSRRRMDADNALSRCKALLDGVADGLGVNDQRFQIHLLFGEVVKQGQIELDIMEV